MAPPDQLTGGGHSLPGLDADVYFGDAESPLPDWRDELPDDDTDGSDEEDAVTPEEYAAVCGILGFDPDDPDGNDPTGNAGFDPNQPRNPLGQWSKGGAGAGKGLATEAGKAVALSDHEHVRRISDFIGKVAGSRAKRGEFGHTGLKEAAKALGMKNFSSLTKPKLAAAIQLHLSGQMATSAQRDRADRLATIAESEKWTGVKYADRVVNGVISVLPVGRSAHYREALGDVMRRGVNAKKEHLSYLRDLRAGIADAIRTEASGQGAHAVTPGILDHVLQGIKEQGHGDLSRGELIEHLGGRKAPEEAPPLIPADLKLAPAKGKRKPVKKREEDYIDRLRHPASDRLARVREIEDKSGVPFTARVLHTLVGDGRVVLPGKDKYLSLVNRMAHGAHLSESEKRSLAGFRAAAAAKVKFGDIDPTHVVDALEAVDGDGKGTVHVDEFLHMLSKAKRRAS